jgi:hypothetical protein
MRLLVIRIASVGLRVKGDFFKEVWYSKKSIPARKRLLPVEH